MILNINKNFALPQKENQHWNKRIKKMRIKAGMSQRDVAHALGCDVGTVARWESGRYMPDIRNQTLLKQLEMRIAKSLAGEPEQDETDS